MEKISRDTWKSIYQLPLKAGYAGLYVFSKNNVMSLSHFHCGKDRVEDIVEIINGRKTHYEPKWKTCSQDPRKIQYGDEGRYSFYVRGWGHLTGVGGMRFDPETAAAIQDQFTNFILKRLNGK